MRKEEVLKEKYLEFIKGLQLKDIQLIDCRMKRDEEFSPVDVDLAVEEKVRYRKTEKGFVVYSTFTLSAVQKQEENERKFQVKATYKASYEAKTEITREIFKLFAASTLILQLWPYFRQLVHDFTSRAGLPPLVLPVVKMVK